MDDKKSVFRSEAFDHTHADSQLPMTPFLRSWPIHQVLTGSALEAKSLWPGQEERTMRKPGTKSGL